MQKYTAAFHELITLEPNFIDTQRQGGKKWSHCFCGVPNDDEYSIAIAVTPFDSAQHFYARKGDSFCDDFSQA